MRRPTVAQRRKTDALLRQLSPILRDAFLAAFQAHANSIDIRALIEALEAGNILRAAELLRMPQGLLFPLDEAMRQAYMAGASLSQFPGVRGVFAFDGRNPSAEAFLRNHAANLVQGIQADTLELTRIVMQRGLSEGRTFQSVAIDIVGRRDGPNRVGGILGLTVQQEASIDRGRRLLASGDIAAYQELKLRDRRFDRLLARVAAGKEKLGQADIDRIIAAHRAKALRFRGELIAKNEAANAAAQGLYESYRQMAEDPRIERVDITWSHGLSLDPRPDHVAMNGTRITLGQLFTFPDGVTMRHPHDPLAPISHNANCRCVGIYRAIPRRSNG